MAKKKDEIVAARFEAEPVESTQPFRTLTSDDSLDVRVEGRDEMPEEGEDKKGPTREELIAKIEAEETARKAAEARADSVEALRSGVERLGDRLQPTPPQTQQQPGESEADFGKRLKEGFFEDPANLLDEWARRKLAPMVSQLASGIQAIARAQVAADPDTSVVFKKYAPEIDKIVAGRQDRFTNPDVYRDALSQVQAIHIKEIITEQVQAALAAQQAESEPAGRAFSERPGGAPAGPRREVVKLTKEEAEQAKILGLTRETYYRAKHKKW